MDKSSPLHTRLKQALQYLKTNKDLLQKDIAKKMGMTEISFSRGIARCANRRDEAFIIRFHQATEELFSLSWLLDGIEPKFTAQCQPNEKEAVTQDIDPSTLVNASIAAYMEAIKAKDQQIEILYERIAELNARLDESATRIHELRQSIQDLRSFMHLPHPHSSPTSSPSPILSDPLSPPSQSPESAKNPPNQSPSE